MTTYADRRLRRVAEAAGISTADLRDLIETIVDERLGLIPRQEQQESARKTGARLVFGASHAACSYVFDPNGTDVVPSDQEAPPGYFGP
jgi:hypothetical protein